MKNLQLLFKINDKIYRIHCFFCEAILPLLPFGAVYDAVAG